MRSKARCGMRPPEGPSRATSWRTAGHLDAKTEEPSAWGGEVAPQASAAGVVSVAIDTELPPLLVEA